MWTSYNRWFKENYIVINGIAKKRDTVSKIEISLYEKPPIYNLKRTLRMKNSVSKKIMATYRKKRKA